MEEVMTTTELPTAATRSHRGAILPVPGVWDLDPGHTGVAFTGRHFMLTKVRGHFAGVTGTVTVAEDPEASAVEVTIDMATVESGNPTRDEHLRSADLFDVATYPTATFRSTAIEWQGTAGTMTGDLTIRDVTRSITFEVTYEGYAKDPWGAHRAVASARAGLNREDFGITWNMALETGGILVSRDIQLEINLEAVLRT
jgi:polyisoprenoid-binding protein YceI